MSDSHVDANTVQSSLANRRNSKRMPARTSVTIEIRKGALGLGANIAGTFLDISEGGVRVIVKVPMAVKDEAEITLTGHGVRKSIKRIATVCWAAKLESGEYALGFLFEKRLPYSEMINFAKP